MNTWEHDRVGRFTASEIWKLFVDPRSKADKEAGKFGEVAETYILEKAVERYTGYRKKFFSKEMEHGVINEKDAFDSFVKCDCWESHKWPGKHKWEFTNKQFFVIGDNAGASPDGILYNGIDPLAVVDVKCPQPLTFFAVKKHYMETGECMDDKYIYQLQMQMMATGTKKSYLYYYLASEFGNTITGEIEHSFDLDDLYRTLYFEFNFDSVLVDQITERINRAEIRCQELLKIIKS